MNYIFNSTGDNVIYSIPTNETGNFFLIVPKSQLKNFEIFVKIHKEDNTRKGTSTTSYEKNVQKQLLEDIKKANEFIKDQNSSYVHSKVNKLPELPVSELEDILNENKPFDMEKYKEVTQKIEKVINDAYKLLLSIDVKKQSIEHTILLIREQETDNLFIEWLLENISILSTVHTLEEIKAKYIKDKIPLDISAYLETFNDNKRFITGTTINNVRYTVEIPLNTNMRAIFMQELNAYDKSTLSNLPPQRIAQELFNNIILKYPSRIINIDDKNNKIAVPQDTTTQSYGYNEEDQAPAKTPQEVVTTEIKSKPKIRILEPSHSNNGFIKIGTAILFTLSFILISLSIILWIIS